SVRPCTDVAGLRKFVAWATRIKFRPELPTNSPSESASKAGPPVQFEPLEISQLPLQGNLPSLPAVALDVLRICQDPKSDIGDLAEGLSRDPILASRVLQMANSAYYNRGTEVTSLNRAAVMIGLRALKVLALGFTLANEL